MPTVLYNMSGANFLDVESCPLGSGSTLTDQASTAIFLRDLTVKRGFARAALSLLSPLTILTARQQRLRVIGRLKGVGEGKKHFLISTLCTVELQR